MEQETRVARRGDTVKINFTCTLEDGTVFDSSEGKEPLEFIIGEGEVFSALDEAVIGMAKNESKTIHLEGENFFGPYAEEKKQVVSRDQFPDSLKPEVGTQFHIQQEDGKSTVLTITDVDESNVTLAPKHPMAGEKLCFEFQVLEFEESNIIKADEFFNQGIAFQDKGQDDEAIKCYQKAIQLNTRHSGAFYNLGVALQKKGQIDKAIVYYEIAIGLNKDSAEANHNLGLAYKESGQFDEAIICFQRVLQLQPVHANAYYNLGNTLVAKGRYSEAMQCYQKTIEINPEHADANWSIGLIHLRLGNFEEGWKRYEKRWELKDVMVKPQFTQPEWNGQKIDGKTILLYAEQGFGDVIQFIRYASLVSEKGDRVIVQCQRELVSLLTNMEGLNQVLAEGEKLPAFDFHFPILSLPLVFNMTLDNLPRKIPYIKTDPNLVQKWQNKIYVDDSILKIGLTWSGSPKFKFGHSRSCSLEVFSPIAKLEGTVFYSLQIGHASGQAQTPPEGMRLLDFTDGIKDFSDTAALLSNLDLIITVDTAVAHLAGALGKPVWTLLPFVPDWRWMLERDDSPWYPTMRLFRQTSPGDWKTVILRIVESLKDFSIC